MLVSPLRRSRTVAALGAALFAVSAAHGQTALPDAPSATLPHPIHTDEIALLQPLEEPQVSSSQPQTKPNGDGAQTNGEPAAPATTIRPQQQRMFGVLANFTSVSGGTKPTPAGWKTDFKLANKQSLDYTAFGFSIATSGIAYAQDSHPALDTVNGGNAPFWAYTWRGLVDKTDQVYQGTLFFPALLHQDTRYYAMGQGSKFKRTMHAVGAIVIAHSYSGRPVFNVAGLAGKVGTQAVSTTYYPAGSQDFGVLATKFAYANLRQAGFTVLREFSPDLTALLHRRHKN